MELPIRRAWIGRCFEPAVGSENIVAAIAIYVARANAVAIAVRADDVFYDAAFMVALIPRKRRILIPELREYFVFRAIVVEISQYGELDVVAGLDLMLLPNFTRLAGIMPPRELLAEPT